MMIRKILLISFLLIVYTTNTYSQSTSIRMDPSTAKGGNISDYFKKVRFIPLETIKESVFGRIYKLQVTDHYFIIYDSDTEAIFLFQKNGKFHRKITPKSGKFISDFSIDREKNQIIVLSTDYITHYNFDGEVEKQDKRNDNHSRIFYFGDDKFAFLKNRSTKYSDISQINFDVVYFNQKKYQKGIIPYDSKYSKYEYNLSRTVFSDQGDNTCFFSLPYKYDIYHLNDSGILNSYNFILPIENSLPHNFSSDSIYLNKRKEYIFNPLQEYTKQIYSIDNIFKHQNNLIFNIKNIGNRIGIINNYLLYNIDKKEVVALNSIASDKLSYNIPILSPNLSQELNAYFKGNLYTSIPAFVFQRLAKENLDLLPSSLKDNIDKYTNKHNIIIIESSFL